MCRKNTPAPRTMNRISSSSPCVCSSMNLPRTALAVSAQSGSFQVISSDIAVLPIRVPSTVPSTSRKAPAVPLRTVVVDIEGTTSATAFVVDRLYPYSAERFADWIDAHHDDPETARAVDQVRELIGEPAVGTDRVVAALRAWLSADEKLTPLKTIQGRIWE